MVSPAMRMQESRIRSTAVGCGRHLQAWLVLLCLAELADLVTTRADRLQGGIEANQVAAFALGVGGPDLFWILKLGVVVAMAAVVLLALHLARAFPSRRAGIVRFYLARSIQVCVLLLTVAAITNLNVLAQHPLAGWFGM